MKKPKMLINEEYYLSLKEQFKKLSENYRKGEVSEETLWNAHKEACKAHTEWWQKPLYSYVVPEILIKAKCS